MFLSNFFKNKHADEKLSNDDLQETICNLNQQLFLRDHRIAGMQREIDKLLEKINQLCKEQMRPALTLTDAIIEVLRKAEEDLHYKEIFDRIFAYNLKNKNPGYLSFKSTIYYLIKKEVVKNGKKESTFSLRNSPWDPR